MATIEGKIQELPGNQLAVIKPALENLLTSMPVIIEKVSRAKAAGSAIKVIEDDDTEGDKNAENFLVKARVTLAQITEMRLGATRQVNEAIKACMVPEKELQAEMDRVKSLRDARASRLVQKEKDKQARIDRDKNIKLEEIRIKNAMKEAVEIGIAKRLTDFESAISTMFFNATLENVDQLEKSLTGIKPSLKEDYFKGLLDIPYNKTLVCEEAFNDLKNRAAEYFWNEKQCNEVYIKTALELAKTWKVKIPSRKKELEKIAAGDEKAKERETINKQHEEQSRKDREAARVEEIKKEAEETKQEESLTVEFKAQVESQAIELVSGTRTKTVFRIDPSYERDMMKLSTLIAKAIINVMTEPNFPGIFQRDKQKNVKRDPKTGDPIYCDGVSFWLEELAKLPYKPRIDGLIETQDISTVAKAS
jgi:hypothetical protein